MKKTETSEKAFERGMSKEVERNGGMAIKLLSQFINGLPDRLYLLPGGIAVFVEFKSTGKKPTVLQGLVMQRIKRLGFEVHVVSNLEEYYTVLNHIGLLIINGR